RRADVVAGDPARGPRRAAAAEGPAAVDRQGAAGRESGRFLPRPAADAATRPGGGHDEIEARVRLRTSLVDARSVRRLRAGSGAASGGRRRRGVGVTEQGGTGRGASQMIRTTWSSDGG